MTIDELSKQCDVTRQTIYNLAKRINAIEGRTESDKRLPTIEEVTNRKQFYKKVGRPTVFKEVL